ncbi:alpha/beta fold hydrolase [Blastopirellula marina]|uniref:Serine aminopeptidase S33 domain-containing protein n=1 Tax=Blastopirellula marina TaxID=124 RepID=A0A2S8GM22_9BACT|nr:hypothetical protein C5Y93_13570 [Blastopirellula marina]
MRRIQVSRRRMLASGFVFASGMASDPIHLFGQSARSGPVTLSLQDGRCLAIQRYGVGDGVPVLYMHATPGARLEGALLDEACRRSHVDLWAIDRPGIGLSTYQAGRSLRNWRDDMRQVIALVQRKRGSLPMGVLGYSGGTSYALATAESFPQEVAAVAILAPRTPGAPGVATGIVDRSLQQVQRHPRMAAWVLRRYRRKVQYNRHAASVLPVAGFAGVDQQFAAQHSGTLRDVLLEATRCGVAGVVRDMQLIPWPWCVSLSQIESPVSLWLGACDALAPRSTVEFLASRIPDCVANVLPAVGHLSVLGPSSDLALQWLSHQVTKGTAK